MLQFVLGCSSRRALSVSMSAVLHVYEPEASTELSDYLDKKRCPLASSFDEAPKLAHSIALELDDALDGEPLLLSDGVRAIGLTVIISEADGMDPLEACLSALGGAPSGATVTLRDFNADRLTGFCCSSSDANPKALSTLTLVSGERIPGLLPAPDGLQPILDATAILADELEEHFEFASSNGDQMGSDLSPIVYGGRAPDGCIVGVLGMR